MRAAAKYFLAYKKRNTSLEIRNFIFLGHKKVDELDELDFKTMKYAIIHFTIVPTSVMAFHILQREIKKFFCNMQKNLTLDFHP